MNWKPKARILTDTAESELFAVPRGDLSLVLFDVTRDGQQFLVANAPSEAAEPLSMIVNWPALVNKRAHAALTANY